MPGNKNRTIGSAEEARTVLKRFFATLESVKVLSIRQESFSGDGYIFMVTYEAPYGPKTIETKSRYKVYLDGICRQL